MSSKVYGNPAYSITIDRATGAAVGEGRSFMNRDGVLTVNHQYISAVCIVHERELAQDWADEEVKRFDDPWDFFGTMRRLCGAGSAPGAPGAT